jgi:ketosteroid isomerase-like protein
MSGSARRSPTAPPWEAEIRALEDEGRRAFLERDLAALEGLWSDTLHVNSPLNVVNPGSTVAELLRTGRIGHISFEAEIEHLARHGDVAIVMGSETIVDEPGGPALHRRFTNVWRLERGSWKLVARHANLVPPDIPGARGPDQPGA